MAPEASYRYEIAQQGRAGCQNSACKKAGIKIQKGELRMGTLVEIPNYSASWKWKHWGCVTPKQIGNVVEQIGGLDGLDLDKDLDILDGYEDLTPEAQGKIKQALIDGHVADEDWKGDPELNRPGQKGINKRKKSPIKSDEDGASDVEASPAKKGAKKGKADKTSDAENAAPKKARGKKRKIEDDDEEIIPAKKNRSKAVKTSAKDEDMDVGGAEPEPPEKKGKKTKTEDAAAPKKAPKKNAVKEEADEEEAAPAPVKKSRGKKAKQEDDAVPDFSKKSRAKKVKAKDEDVEQDNADEVALAKKSSRAKNVKKETDESGSKPAASSRSRKVKQDPDTTQVVVNMPAPRKRGAPTQQDRNEVAAMIKGEDAEDVEVEATPEIDDDRGKQKRRTRKRSRTSKA